MKIKFTVLGEASPAGSKRHVGRGIIIDACKTTKSWQQQVRYAARQAYQGPLLEGAIGVTYVFYSLRPRGHFGTGKNAGKLKASAPAFKITRPDDGKLCRAVDDSLTNVVWLDDAQVVQKHVFKNYAPPGEPARVEISIHTLN